MRPAARQDRAASVASPRLRGEEDRVELSDRALLLAKLRELPEVREDVIARARERIASGAYETGEVLAATVDALARDIDLLA